MGRAATFFALVIFTDCLLLLSFQANGQNSTWSILHSTPLERNSVGVYFQTANVSAAPGARSGAAAAFHSRNREFWMYGGLGCNDTMPPTGYCSEPLGDLWRYSVNSDIWAYVGGTSDYQQSPIYVGGSARPGALANPLLWIDEEAGHVYLFGGVQYNNADLIMNGLWRFDMTRKTWMFLKGDTLPMASANFSTPLDATPGARFAAAGAYDRMNKQYWLFGGTGVDCCATVGKLNDMWTYFVQNNTWAYITGPKTAGDYGGIYGDRSVFNSSNVPPARNYAAASYDYLNRELWVYGGSDSANGNLGDVWKFNTVRKSWAWMGGDQIGGEGQPVYGAQGVPDASNHPGIRASQMLVFDSASRSMYMFGGYGSGANASGEMNDLWRLYTPSYTWTWIDGSINPKSDIDSVLYPSVSVQMAVAFDEVNREAYWFGGAPDPAQLGDQLWRFTLPAVVGCAGSPPVPSAFCVNGSYVISGNLSVADSTEIIISDHVIINGSLHLAPTSTILVSGSALVTASGCVSLGGNLIVNVDTSFNATRGTNVEIPVLSFEGGYCDGKPTTFNYTSVLVVSNSSNCVAITNSRTQYKDRLVSVVFDFSSDGPYCPVDPVGSILTVGAIVGIAVAAATVVFIVVATILCYPFRSKVRPNEQHSSRTTNNNQHDPI